MITRIFGSFAVVGLLLALAACSSSESNSYDTGARTESQAQTGQSTAEATPVAPSVTFAVYDVNGTLQQSSQWIGKKPVVINFWGTWCPPCRKEIPEMVKLYDEYQGKNIELIGLAVNDTPDKVVNFARTNKMNWVMLMADEGVINAFAPITGVPTTVFLDHTGKEVHRHIGPISYKQLKQAFDALLAMDSEGVGEVGG
jgi:thiol-disulfide isomerase/thioredoxin